MQYTIESRPLTTESTHRAAYDGRPRQTTVEAASADDAITQFVRQSAAQLVSFTSPSAGKESIATMRKDDFVFLVRVYSD